MTAIISLIFRKTYEGDTFNGKSGEDIANEIYNHPNECKDPANGGVWAPLPKGQTCGAEGNCAFPQKWCSAKQDGSSSNPALSCQDLPPDCQKVLAGGGPGVTAAPQTEATTSQAQTTAAQPSTQTTKSGAGAVTTKPSSAPAGTGTTSQPSTGNCQDGHPFCCFWADDKSGRPSECDRNSKWMKSMCKKSCGTCGCTSGDCPTKVNTQGCQYLNGGQGGPGGPGGQGNRVRITLSGSPAFPGFAGPGNGFGGPGNGFGGPGNGIGGGQVPPGMTRIALG